MAAAIVVDAVFGNMAAHIIGDIFDRGAHPDTIMDFLMDYHDVDFQWGNHDVVWMGAATGNWACITNLLRINKRIRKIVY